MTRFLFLCGARPNVMKLAALQPAFEQRPNLETCVVHTGQHYDERLAQNLFAELGMRDPDVHLDVGPGALSWQMAEILRRLDPVLAQFDPDRVIVVGDVTSTLAGALAAANRGIPVAHVESGLRSFDSAMPEERNRRLTDHLSDRLFVTEPAGVENLLREGVDPEAIHLVGNVMIDTLERERTRASNSDVRARLGLKDARYLLATLHRPENVDDPRVLREVFDALAEISRDFPVLFPVHPRTRQRLEASSIGDRFRCAPGIRLLDPLGYREFLHLHANAAAVLTDSGGVQEEAAVLRVPCLTLRRSTERPATLEHGSSRLVASNARAIVAAWSAAVRGEWPVRPPPPLWDGHAAFRIADVLLGSASAASVRR